VASCEGWRCIFSLNINNQVSYGVEVEGDGGWDNDTVTVIDWAVSKVI